MRIPALVLALILPLIMVFSAALVIQAGIRMDSAEDLKTKDYFQTSAFADSFYSKGLPPAIYADNFPGSVFNPLMKDPQARPILVNYLYIKCLYNLFCS